MKEMLSKNSVSSFQMAAEYVESDQVQSYSMFIEGSLDFDERILLSEFSNGVRMR
jgi:hypothetical protein